MICITGDIHGTASTLLFNIKKFGLGKDDAVVLLGDVGANYYGGKKDRLFKQTMNNAGITFFCVHGNHEKRPQSLGTYVEKEWHGGTVYVEEEYPNLLFAKDGEIFELEGRSAAVIGGAYSVDKYYRMQKGWAWFSDEQPSDEIKRRAEANLTARNWRVDLVLTHTCPFKYMPTESFIPGLDQSTVDNSTEEWLDEIENRLDYDEWYCGHFHIEKRIDKMHFMFHGIETLTARS